MLIFSPALRVAAQRHKLSHLQKIAKNQSLDYMNSLDRNKTATRELLKVDPLFRDLHKPGKSINSSKPGSRLQASSAAATVSEDLLLDSVLNPKYSGIVSQVKFPGFGSVTISHGDLLEASSTVSLVLPLPPNLHAFRGVSQRFLEKAGADFARLLFRKAREICPEPSRQGLPIGTVISVPWGERRVYFLVMPSYWQGNTTDARRRFRFAVSELFSAVNRDENDSLALCHLGRGVFGFDQDWTWTTLAQEIVETGLLQIGNSNGRATLKNVQFIEEDFAAASSLNAAISEILETRSRATIQTDQSVQPRVVLHTLGELNKAKRVDKVKFRKFSGIIRNLRLHYKRFIRPHVWRSPKMNPAISDKPNPHFYRGVTHTLFPRRPALSTPGFAGLRRTASGRLRPRIVSVARRIQEQSRMT